MKKIFKKTICLILATVLFSATALYAVKPITAASGTINYVSLGDSYSNGYGLDSGDAGSYAALFKDKLTSQGYTVNYTQLAYAGMRPADIYYILNPDASRDSYANTILANVPSDKTAFETAISNADVITLNLGYSNLWNFIKRRLPYSNLKLWNLYSGSIDTDTLDDLLAKFEKTVNVDELTQQVSSLMTALDGDDIVGYIYGKDTGALTVDGFSNIILHSYVSFAAYYKLLTDQIYALNPDVELIVLGVKNITDGLKVTCGSTTYDADKVFNGLANLENLYMASVEGNGSYYFVDVNGGITVNNYINELKTYNTTGNLKDLSQSLVNRIIEATFDPNCVFLGVNIAETLSDSIAKIAGIKVKALINEYALGDFAATLFSSRGGLNSTVKELLNDPNAYINATYVKQAFNNICYSQSTFDLTRQNTLFAGLQDAAAYMSSDSVLALFNDIDTVGDFLSVLVKSPSKFSGVLDKVAYLVCDSTKKTLITSAVDRLNMTRDEFLVLVYTVVLKIVARAVSLDSVNADDILQVTSDKNGKLKDVVTSLFMYELNINMTADMTKDKALTDAQKNGGMGIVDLFSRYYFLDGLCSHPNAAGNTALADAAYNAHTSASSRTDYAGLTQNISTKDGSSVKDILIAHSFRFIDVTYEKFYGDSIDILDAIILKKNLGSTDLSYDVNDDKSVTIADLQALMEMILSFEN